MMNESERCKQLEKALASVGHDIINLFWEAQVGLDRLARANATEYGDTTLQDVSESLNVAFKIAQSVLQHYTTVINGVDLKKTTFSTRELLDDIKRHFISQAQKKGLIFDVVANDNVPEAIIADKGKVVLILFNLVHNALKFTEQGTIEARMEFEETSKTLTLSVTDTGIGIPPDKSGPIFRCFEQAHDIQGNHGVGLGLSICHSLTTALGGTIRVHRLSGVNGSVSGTCFKARFPIEEPIMIPQSKPRDYSPMTLMIVDDSSTQRLVVEKIANELGCDIVAASQGKEALKLLDSCETPPSLILVDGNMPVMNGPETVQKLRETEACSTKSLPVYAFSGSDPESQDVVFDDKLIQGYVQKPLTKERLQEILVEVTSLAS